MREELSVFFAFVGSTPIEWRVVARQTYLNAAHVDSLRTGRACYRFYLAANEPLAQKVLPEERKDTVLIANHVLPSRNASLNPQLARAWGVDGAPQQSPYVGPKYVSSAGRWSFLLINVMRHATRHFTFRYLVKPELDGLVCVDALVATLQLTRGWQPWVCGMLRGCHFDDAFVIYDAHIVRSLAAADHWERRIVPRLRAPNDVLVVKHHCAMRGDRYVHEHSEGCYDKLEVQNGRVGVSLFGRYLPRMLQWVHEYSGQTRNQLSGSTPPNIWAFTTHKPFGSWVYLHSSRGSIIANQWSFLNRSLARGGKLARTEPTGRCDGRSSWRCAVQKLSCKHAFFIHKVKDTKVIRELWEAQLQQAHDYGAAAPEQLRNLAGLNRSSRVLGYCAGARTINRLPPSKGFLAPRRSALPSSNYSSEGSANPRSGVAKSPSAPCCKNRDPEPGRMGRCAFRASKGACGNDGNWTGLADACPVACRVCTICRGHPTFEAYTNFRWRMSSSA